MKNLTIILILFLFSACNQDRLTFEQQSAKDYIKTEYPDAKIKSSEQYPAKPTHLYKLYFDQDEQPPIEVVDMVLKDTSMIIGQIVETRMYYSGQNLKLVLFYDGKGVIQKSVLYNEGK